MLFFSTTYNLYAKQNTCWGSCSKSYCCTLTSRHSWNSRTCALASRCQLICGYTVCGTGGWGGFLHSFCCRTISIIYTGSSLYHCRCCLYRRRFFFHRNNRKRQGCFDRRHLGNAPNWTLLAYLESYCVVFLLKYNYQIIYKALQFYTNCKPSFFHLLYHQCFFQNRMQWLAFIVLCFSLDNMVL